METIATLDRVTYTYPGRPQPALRDVSLRLHPAEVVLLVPAAVNIASVFIVEVSAFTVGMVFHTYK